MTFADAHSCGESSYSEVDPEKLANLLVLECIKIVECHNLKNNVNIQGDFL